MPRCGDIAGVYAWRCNIVILKLYRINSKIELINLSRKYCRLNQVLQTLIFIPPYNNERNKTPEPIMEFHENLHFSRI